MSLTAADIIGLAHEKAKTDQDQVNLPALEETHLLSVLHDANTEYVERFRDGGGNGPRHMFSEKFFSLQMPATYVSQSLDSVKVDDSTVFDEDGAAVIYGSTSMVANVIEYTEKDATNLLAVTRLAGAFASGDRVYKLYKLPDDFGWLLRDKDGNETANIGYTKLQLTTRVPAYTWESSYYVKGSEFSIVPSADPDGPKYVWVSPGYTSGTLVIPYCRKPTDITNASSLVDTPTGHKNFLVFRLVQHIYHELGEGEAAEQYAYVEAEKVIARALRSRSHSNRISLKV